MIVPMSVNNEIFIGGLFQIEDSGASASNRFISVIGGGLEWCIGQKRLTY